MMRKRLDTTLIQREYSRFLSFVSNGKDEEEAKVLETKVNSDIGSR